MLSESLEQRLEWFQRHRYVVGQDVFILEENQQGGYAKINCQASNVCFIFQIEDHRLECLQNGSCADRIIFERTSNHSWNLHIIECKRTVTESSWKKTKEQFEGALLNALALMGVLGIEKIEMLKFYTAFRRDKLTEQESTNPVLHKTQVGVPVHANPIIEWKNDRIHILSLKNVIHQKIILDNETGIGNLIL